MENIEYKVHWLQEENKRLREALNMIITTYDMPNTVLRIAKKAVLNGEKK